MNEDFEEFKKKCKGRKDKDFCFIKSSRGLPIGGSWTCSDCYELSKYVDRDFKKEIDG